MTVANGFRWGSVGSLGGLLLAVFLIAHALLALAGVFTAGHAVSIGDVVSLIELGAGVLILIGR